MTTGALAPGAAPLAAATALAPFALVGLGGVVGALARHLVGECLDEGVGGTLLVNVLGSYALGVVLTAPVDDAAVLAFGAGFCGAFTTFSTFAVETVRLFEVDEPRRAAANAVGTLLLALLAVAAGSATGRLLPR